MYRSYTYLNSYVSVAGAGPRDLHVISICVPFDAEWDTLTLIPLRVTLFGPYNPGGRKPRLLLEDNGFICKYSERGLGRKLPIWYIAIVIYFLV